MTVPAVDCQSFAGGLALGTVQAGFDLVAKRELPGGFGAPSMLHNRALLGDFEYQDGPWEEWLPESVPYVFGNPPCSGFSLATTSTLRGSNARINDCMWALMNYAARCRPEVIVMESVQPAFSMGRELMQALRDQVEKDTGDLYALHHVKHQVYYVGGVQSRPRYFCVLARVPFGVEPWEPDGYWPTLADALTDLPEEAADTVDPVQVDPRSRSPWVHREAIANGTATVDGHVVEDRNGEIQRVLELLRTPVEWPAGRGIHLQCEAVLDAGFPLPPIFDSLRARAEKKGWSNLGGFFQPRRWASFKPSRVIAGSASLVVHPWLPRTITLREAYRLMGFPDAWRLAPVAEDVGVKAAFTFPGKGVTVQAGRWISTWAYRSISGEPGADSGIEIGDREFLVDHNNVHKTLVQPNGWRV